MCMNNDADYAHINDTHAPSLIFIMIMIIYAKNMRIIKCNMRVTKAKDCIFCAFMNLHFGFIFFSVGSALNIYLF